jgi:hypothetical protein
MDCSSLGDTCARRKMLTGTLSADRFSRDRPRFNDTLDVIKFLCKDVWMLVFRKQVDNLKTNHRVRAAGQDDSGLGIQTQTVC